MRTTRREKVFGPGRAVPLDRNAKARIASLRARLGPPVPPAGPERRGPRPRRPGRSGRSAMGVPQRPLGRLLPSYETIAEKAGCARSTVAEALKALEWAGVLTWQNRITRDPERCRDLFGRDGWRWRVIRTSNAYVFRDPAVSSKSDNRTGTQNQELNLILYWHQRSTQTARSSVPLPDSPQPSQQSKAANKPPLARTEPQNPAQERT